MMELHIKERLLIPGILPEQNNFNDFNLKKSILDKVSVTAKDKAEYGIVENEKTQWIEWDIKKDSELPLNVEFTKEEKEYLVKACERIADQAMSDETWSVVDFIYNESKK